MAWLLPVADDASEEGTPLDPGDTGPGPELPGMPHIEGELTHTEPSRSHSTQG